MAVQHRLFVTERLEARRLFAAGLELVHDFDPRNADSMTTTTTGGRAADVALGKAWFGVTAGNQAGALYAADPAARTATPIQPRDLGFSRTGVVEAGGFALWRRHGSPGTQLPPQELWRSDGTAAGTTRVATLLAPPPQSVQLTQQAAAAGLYFFAAHDAEAAAEPWVSDGTAAGTRRLADIHPGAGLSAPGAFLSGGDRAFFLATDPARRSVYVSDGTAGGTRPFFAADVSAAVAGATPVWWSGSRLVVRDGGGALWGGDGTAAGTVRVVTSATGFVPAGGRLYAADLASGILRVTDGTTAGTRLVADLPVAINRLAGGTAGGRVYFVDDSLHRLWASDGTPGGTAPLRADDLRVPPATFGAVVGERYYFTGHPRPATPVDNELWASDGTEAGTGPVADLNPAAAGYPFSLTAVGTRLFFSAVHPVAGREPFVSDGTAAGTAMLADLETGPLDGAPDQLTLLGGRRAVAFAAGGDLHAVDLATGAAARLGDFDRYYETTGAGPTTAVAGGAFYYSGIAGSPDRAAVGLYRSDGTPAGTRLVHPSQDGYQVADRLSPFGSRLLFAQSDRPHVYDPAAGTSQPLVPPAGDVLVAGAALRFVAAGGLAYFAARTLAPGSAEELWRTDGTPGGTFAVAGPVLGTSPRELVELAGRLHYTAVVGSEMRLLSTGGAAGDVQTVAVLGPAPTYPPAGRPAGEAARAGGRIYFNGPGGLWASDGTAAGTVQVHPSVGVGTSASTSFAAALPDGRLVYSGADRGLWATDGTPAGTRQLLPPSSSAAPSSLTAAGGQVYLAAHDATVGEELWVTDGTPEGTALLADLQPGPRSSTPVLAGVADGSIYLAITDPGAGRELFRLGVAPAVRSVAVNGGAAQRSRVAGLTVTFDRPVTAADGAFALAGRNGAGAGVTVAAANPSGDGRTWELTFAGPGVVAGSLPDGVYDLTVAGGRVRGGSAAGPAMAADHAFVFHRLFGDGNGSRGVNNADFLLFRQTFGKAAGDPAFNAAFDLDNNGLVNNADYLQFRSRFGLAFTY